MNRLIIALAVLGAGAVGALAAMLLPNGPAGRTISFFAFGVALYPVARQLWFADVPAWRYWAGLAVGCAISWGLDVWRTGWSDRANMMAAMATVSLLALASLASLWRAARKRH